MIPKVTPLPQISHFAICLHLLMGQYYHATLVYYQSLRPKARTFLHKAGFSRGMARKTAYFTAPKKKDAPRGF
ncbi:MAG: hypothetical protein KIG21_01895 [Angelakisella sp.]|nr:hypothetical protein [Angelakisella sp.]